MYNKLPRCRESLVTFFCQMGNKKLSEMHLKRLRVNKKKVIVALKLLKIHHSGYHDITINVDNLNWTEGEKESTFVAGMQYIEMNDKKGNENRQSCPKILCAGDSLFDARLQSSTTATSKASIPQTNKQSRPLDELNDILKTDKSG